MLVMLPQAEDENPGYRQKTVRKGEDPDWGTPTHYFGQIIPCR